MDRYNKRSVLGYALYQIITLKLTMKPCTEA